MVRTVQTMIVFYDSISQVLPTNTNLRNKDDGSTKGGNELKLITSIYNFELGRLLLLGGKAIDMDHHRPCDVTRRYCFDSYSY